MKKPSRMRNMAQESSALENDWISTTDDKTQSVYLVSSKYNRRIFKPAHSVKFSIPKLDFKTSKDLNSLNSIAGDNDISDFKKSERFRTSRGSLGSCFDDAFRKRLSEYPWGSRRMSAPELPPISANGKKTGLLTNGYTRTNTFHNYKFNNNNNNNVLNGLKEKKRDNHSDSSVQGYTLNSRTSSSSSQGRSRVLSAGTDRRTNKHLLSVELPKDLIVTPNIGVKTEGSAMRSGPNTPTMPRCVSSKRSSVKDVATTQRKLQPCTSESQISRTTNGHIKRIHSDKSLTDSTKKMSRNLVNNSKTVTAKRSSIINNVNGLRKYSSTLGLDTKDERNSDESMNGRVDFNDDSDSDSEKDQRVIEWIIGVNEVAEPPEEPLIEHTDEPPQRDTAIRIVYDGDS